MPATDPVCAPPQLSLAQLFVKFLRFGCLAFGGPVAQIAMIRQALVDEEKWIDSPRFNRLLAVMQVLPGPEAHELCVHMGMTARGRIGGLLAVLGFMLPGFVLMLACAWAYEEFIAGRPGLAGLMLGVQVAVLAVILRAIHRSSSTSASRIIAICATGPPNARQPKRRNLRNSAGSDSDGGVAAESVTGIQAPWRTRAMPRGPWERSLDGERLSGRPREPAPAI